MIPVKTIIQKTNFAQMTTQQALAFLQTKGKHEREQPKYFGGVLTPEYPSWLWPRPIYRDGITFPWTIDMEIGCMGSCSSFPSGGVTWNCGISWPPQAKELVVAPVRKIRCLTMLFVFAQSLIFCWRVYEISPSSIMVSLCFEDRQRLESPSRLYGRCGRVS